MIKGSDFDVDNLHDVNNPQSLALGKMGLGGNAIKLLQRKVDKHDFQ